MIRYLTGTLAGKEQNLVILDVDGIGYEINVPSNSAVYLRNPGEEIKLYTHVTIREDDISFYGFASTQELELFKSLIKVNGVGAKAALAILSAMPVTEIKKAIVFEDADMITRANGVGKKTAQKIVLELKDKLSEIGPQDDAGVVSGSAAAPEGGARSEALDALMNLGYSRAEALSALSGVEGDDLTLEEYIRAALRSQG